LTELHDYDLGVLILRQANMPVDVVIFFCKQNTWIINQSTKMWNVVKIGIRKGPV